MSKIVRISDETFQRLKRFAEPFDTRDDALSAALDAAEEWRADNVPAPDSDMHGETLH